jgi:hypothetical protein
MRSGQIYSHNAVPGRLNENEIPSPTDTPYMQADWPPFRAGTLNTLHEFPFDAHRNFPLMLIAGKSACFK